MQAKIHRKIESVAGEGGSWDKLHTELPHTAPRQKNHLHKFMFNKQTSKTTLNLPKVKLDCTSKHSLDESFLLSQRSS